ncbi:DUF2442 domain-containing protein [Lamprocystis purpurea]|uniref:DUF2442 domain-containing protein n=1 Tax=Lamprocystis purpurea TaxID=61598 RepID=UPI0003A31D34|nr:DUF2442 domain-containing protein [Lamprocystis purpurea]
MLTVISVKAVAPATIEAALSDGRTLTLEAATIIGSAGYEALTDADCFANIVVADWGHGIEWPAIDQGLSVETLTRMAREQAGTAFPTAGFNAWMERNGLTLSAAAQALGLSRRTITYYHAGQKPIPIYIGLACEGWEVRNRSRAA